MHAALSSSASGRRLIWLPCQVHDGLGAGGAEHHQPFLQHQFLQHPDTAVPGAPPLRQAPSHSPTRRRKHLARLQQVRTHQAARPCNGRAWHAAASMCSLACAVPGCMWPTAALNGLTCTGAVQVSWPRVRVANALASSGEEWVAHLDTHNSGTYNNQVCTSEPACMVHAAPVRCTGRMSP